MKKSITLILLLVTAFIYAQDLGPTVDVIGEGIIRVVPDEVTVTVRVENSGKDAALIKQENDRTVNNVLDFVKKMGVEEKNVRTEYINLNKNYDYNSKTYSYTANQTISILLKDLKKYEDLMNGLLKSGINRIDGVAFSSSKIETLEVEARKKAVLDAKDKAAVYAGVLEQRIGNAVKIREMEVNNYPPQPMFRLESSSAMDKGSDQQTLAPGELEISRKVSISFQLYNKGN